VVRPVLPIFHPRNPRAGAPLVYRAISGRNVLPITPDRASSTSGREERLPCISCSLAAGRRHPGALALLQLVAALTAAAHGAEPRSYGLPLGQLALQAGALLKSQSRRPRHAHAQAKPSLARVPQP
jgi:hypothetical protein